MPKPKGAPTLFEMLEQKSSDKIEKDRAAPSKTEEDAPADAAEWAGGRREQDSPEVSKEPSERSRPGNKPGPLPFLQLEDGRIRLSVSTLTAALALTAAVALVTGAYKVGRELGFHAGQQAYSAKTIDEVAAARNGPVTNGLLSALQGSATNDSAVVGPLLTENSATEGAERQASAADAVWVRGNTYVLVQEFLPGSGDDIYKAQQFLADQGVETAIVPSNSGGSLLITTQGFKLSNAAQRKMGEELLERVRNIGHAYMNAGGRYRFDGYFKTLKGDTW